MAKEDDYKDYSSEHKMVISRETQKLERARERAEALEANMAKGLAAAIKASKEALRKDASKSVNRAENGALSPVEKAMMEAAQKGTDRIFIDEGIITGESESRNPRYSEEDDF